MGIEPSGAFKAHKLLIRHPETTDRNARIARVRYTRGTRSLALAVLLLASVVGTSAAQDHRVFRVPFHTANGLSLLDAELNGKPAVFLLDSGSNVSFLDVNSSSIRFKAQKVRRLGMSGCLAEHSRLNLGGWETSEQKMCIADLSDVSKDVATRIAGLIGGTVLEQFSVVRIDYRAHEVQFEQ